MTLKPRCRAPAMLPALMPPMRLPFQEVQMPKFVMLTRLDPEVLRGPTSLEQLESRAMDAIREQCPGVSWLSSYAVLGPRDYVDTSEAPDNETAAKVSLLIRTHGHAHSEVWPATDWQRFKEMVHGMK
jgi:uncharacterized protein with GYD domain